MSFTLYVDQAQGWSGECGERQKLGPHHESNWNVLLHWNDSGTGNFEIYSSVIYIYACICSICSFAHPSFVHSLDPVCQPS